MPEPADNTSHDPFAPAVNELQATAKWIIAIFGAVAAVLVAGTQLSGLGQLRPSEPRLWVAIVAGAIGLVCVGVIISNASRVLTQGHITRSSLLRLSENYRPDLRQLWLLHPPDCLQLNDPALTSGFATISDLVTAYDRAIADRKTFYDGARSRSLTEPEAVRAEELENEVAYYGDIVGQVVAAARYNEVCKLFKVAMRVLLAAGFIAALAIGTFAWAVNPPESNNGATASASATVEPTKP